MSKFDNVIDHNTTDAATSDMTQPDITDIVLLCFPNARQLNAILCLVRAVMHQKLSTLGYQDVAAH